jgi:hypothetical protein
MDLLGPVLTASHHTLHGLINSQCSLTPSNNFRTDTELISSNFRTEHNFRRIFTYMKKKSVGNLFNLDDIFILNPKGLAVETYTAIFSIKISVFCPNN